MNKGRSRLAAMLEGQAKEGGMEGSPTLLGLVTMALLQAHSDTSLYMLTTLSAL